jgi:hypothetical protein
MWKLRLLTLLLALLAAACNLQQQGPGEAGIPASGATEIPTRNFSATLTPSGPIIGAPTLMPIGGPPTPTGPWGVQTIVPSLEPPPLPGSAPSGAGSAQGQAVPGAVVNPNNGSFAQGGNGSAPPIGGSCQVYITYSGRDPANLLSLRSQPSVSAPQVAKIPNNVQVFLVPNTQEIAADGYHWLNIIYVDSFQNRYQGWTARDGFSTNGVADPSVATLRPAGQQAAC